ncbi:MAG: UDP-N-acetylglucosamine--N-acetylmuramyl-(pentapeptide) pyrophosphoryl-undecaprenol N-acetylglucosamine transferase [Rhodoluna sp.]|nr:UDP-N-acetylglucosamine--N-acetylmuramyl-(pentapeptide) pyrophosphoryl-undecaprenol N-acetylglucosamine transferase [Rhodoluna sp.]
MTTYLLAGGGTAGHVNPLLALADRIRLHEPDAVIIALGTAEGLESRLVPLRGYELVTVARLPFPRKPNKYALGFPAKYRTAVSSVRNLIRSRGVDVVVGFGGYASAPAYDAARAEKVPYVVHEANALPGMANRRGAKRAAAVGVAFQGTPLKGSELVGMPLRPEIESIIKGTDKAAARKHFGLDESTVTLLVTGGSLGAKRINETIEKSRHVLEAAGIQVLHIMGGRSDLVEVHDPHYVRIAYCDRMELAITAADVAVARAGAATVSEFSAVGLPAIYVPYPVGNGEQALNARSSVAAGASLLVKDADFTPEYVTDTIVPLVSNNKRIATMSDSSALVAITDGAERLYRLVAGLKS